MPGQTHAAWQPDLSQQLALEKSRQVACENAGGRLGHGRRAERDREPRAGTALHRPRYGVSSCRPRLSDLRSRLYGGSTARRIEGDLEENDQGVGAFIVGLGSRVAPGRSRRIITGIDLHLSPPRGERSSERSERG